MLGLSYLDGVAKDYGWDRVNWTLEVLSLQLQADTGVELSCSYARTGRIIHGVAEHKNAQVFCQFLEFLSSTYRRAK